MFKEFNVEHKIDQRRGYLLKIINNHILEMYFQRCLYLIKCKVLNLKRKRRNFDFPIFNLNASIMNIIYYVIS